MIGISIVCLGMIGIVLNRSSIIRMLMSLELILIGLIMMSYMVSMKMDDMTGIILGLMILGVAGGESSIGLGVLINYNRIKGDISMGNIIQG